jgi:hypothetical protein
MDMSPTRAAGACFSDSYAEGRHGLQVGTVHISGIRTILFLTIHDAPVAWRLGVASAFSMDEKEWLAQIQARKLRDMVSHAFRNIQMYNRLY